MGVGHVRALVDQVARSACTCPSESRKPVRVGGAIASLSGRSHEGAEPAPKSRIRLSSSRPESAKRSRLRSALRRTVARTAARSARWAPVRGARRKKPSQSIDFGPIESAKINRPSSWFSPATPFHQAGEVVRSALLQIDFSILATGQGHCRSLSMVHAATSQPLSVS